MDRTLDPEKIVATADALARRIHERFPDLNLVAVSDKLGEIAKKCVGVSEQIERPYRALRICSALLLLVVLGLVLVGIHRFSVPLSVQSVSELAQGVEASVNDVAFICVALYFVLTVETRLKRKLALHAIRDLRALAHIIDMHQLTKDPEGKFKDVIATASSPERTLSGYELWRYLDYCSEMLSILAKLAAMLVQNFDDSVVLSAVDEVEALTVGFSQKIWQKIMILHLTASR